MIRSSVAVASILVLASCGDTQAGTLQTSAPIVSDLIPAAGVTFRCTPIKVYDGDGPLWCEEGQRIRLAGIAAREADGTCRSNQPCPDATAEEARLVLAMLVSGHDPAKETLTIGFKEESSGHLLVGGGPALTCTSNGPAGGKRVGAWCVSPVAGDLSCAMLRSGTVAKWQRFWRDHRC